MIEGVKSKEEIRAWLNIYFKGGQMGGLRDYSRELPTMAFCRGLGLDDGELTRFKRGQVPITARWQRMLSRFIGLWEAGYIGFELTPRRGSVPPKWNMVRYLTPKNPKHTFAVQMQERGPKLTLLPRSPVFPDMPSMRAFSPLTAPPPAPTAGRPRSRY